MNIYQNIYNLINQYIFNNGIIVGSYEELVTILISTFACLLCVALPFMIVYKFFQWVARI